MTTERIITVGHYISPCGTLLLGSIDNKLCLCDWQVEKRRDKAMPRLLRLTGAKLIEGSSDVINQTKLELDEYFSGKRTEFSIPLTLFGSNFQKQVWNELINLPYGTTMSYLNLAHLIGKPSAVRAVANANGANAISIIIPCHRIIGSDNTLTGYGGGLNIKKFLLDLESRRSKSQN